MRTTHSLVSISNRTTIQHSAIFMVCIAIVFSSLSYANTEDSSSRKIDEKAVQSCGPLSLTTTLSLLGRSVEAYRCAELSGTHDDGITTLTGLQNAAKILGETAIGMRLTPRELSWINLPAILHVTLPKSEDHFVVYTPGNNASFALIDPTLSNSKNILTAEQLTLMWKGDSLVFTPNSFLTFIKIGVWRTRGIIAALGGLIFGLLAAILIIAKLPRQPWFSLNISLYYATLCHLLATLLPCLWHGGSIWGEVVRGITI